MRRDHGLVDEELYPYYQDVYDHILRITESTDALRDLVSTIVETNLSLRDFRTNQIMKKVTSWAAIIAVPDAHHRLVRHERALSRARAALGRLGRGDVLIVVCSGLLYMAFKTERLAVSDGHDRRHPAARV